MDFIIVQRIALMSLHDKIHLMDITVPLQISNSLGSVVVVKAVVPVPEFHAARIHIRITMEKTTAKGGKAAKAMVLVVTEEVLGMLAEPLAV